MLRLVDETVRIFLLIDAALVSFFFDPPQTHARCPNCEGTDMFDGKGLCQYCDAI